MSANIQRRLAAVLAADLTHTVPLLALSLFREAKINALSDDFLFRSGKKMGD